MDHNFSFSEDTSFAVFYSSILVLLLFDVIWSFSKTILILLPMLTTVLDTREIKTLKKQLKYSKIRKSIFWLSSIVMGWKQMLINAIQMQTQKTKDVLKLDHMTCLNSLYAWVNFNICSSYFINVLE